MKSTELLTILEFAQKSGLSPATIRRRIADGSLAAWQPGGHRTAVRLPATLLETMASLTPNLPRNPPLPATRQSHPRWRRT
jgi:excisionase family DNA binding protein